MSVQVQPAFQKPDRSYAYLICAAINATDDKMATVAQIYQYFIENYDFYKFSPTPHTWKRAVRKRLCSDPCFHRIEPQFVGGYWCVSPDFSHIYDHEAAKGEGSC
ncbi:hypothetical protein FKM82_011194 [Ascaphus truei]